MRFNNGKQNALAITLPAWAILFALIGLGPSSGRAETQEKTKKNLELTKLEHLDTTAMAEVRGAALKLGKHANEVSRNVYSQTPALEHASGTSPKSEKPITMAQQAAKAAKITADEAVEIALKTVPGEVTDVAIEVAIEKKLGANRYVVEVISKEDGSETDVIIDMQTGKVLATEN